MGEEKVNLESWAEQVNSSPIEDFLGLSPEQLFLLLYRPFEELDHILSFDSCFDSGLLDTALVVRGARLLIKLIGEAGEVKATQHGFLPKKILNPVHDSRLDEEELHYPKSDNSSRSTNCLNCWSRRFAPRVRQEYAPKYLVVCSQVLGI